MKSNKCWYVYKLFSEGGRKKSTDYWISRPNFSVLTIKNHIYVLKTPETLDNFMFILQY